MWSRRRTTPSKVGGREEEAEVVKTIPDDKEDDGEDKPRRKAPSAAVPRRGRMAALCLTAAFVITFIWMRSALSSLSRYTWTYLITLFPVAGCLLLSFWPALSSSSSSSSSSFWNWRRLFPLTVVISVAGAQLPAWLGQGLAALALLAFALATLPLQHHPDMSGIKDLHQRQNGEAQDDTNQQHTATFAAASSTSNATTTTKLATTSPREVLLATVVLVMVLLTENFMVWVVSATFQPGWRADTAPPPLQDNGRRILQGLLSDWTRAQAVQLRRIWNVQWTLVACLGVSFMVVEVFHPVRQLYSLGVRAVYTLAAARGIRTVSFLLTVLPSQVPNCYQQRFPYPPPTDPWAWWAVGWIPAQHGGCHDLILSGHATVTSTLACVVTSVADDSRFSLLLWVMVLLDYAMEIYEGFHYSVDMWLGAVVVTLLWHVLQPLEPYDYGRRQHRANVTTWSSSSSTSTSDHSSATWVSYRPPTVRDVLIYGAPACLAYLQLTCLPSASGNGVIVLYIAVIISVYGWFGRERPPNREITTSANKSISLASNDTTPSRHILHWIQHTILCLLYMAVGLYL